MDTLKTEAIAQSIRQVYKKRVILPILYLLFLAILWLAAPLSDLVFPHPVSATVPLRELRTKHSYISTTLTGLHFTGYTKKIFGFTNGCYYYTFQDGQCILALLKPASCGNGQPDIGQLDIQARVIRDFAEYETLTLQIAEDLDWTASGIRSQIPNYLLSEPAFHNPASFLLLCIYFTSGVYALIQLAASAVYICCPVLAPACQKLGRYGNTSQQLAQAEAELLALPQPAAEDIYITKHYFIALTESQTAVVPIHKILWIYKRAAHHKYLRHHVPIVYTLHIKAAKGVHIECPDITEPDIDGIIECLSEANPAVLVGFHEKHRKKAQKIAKHF